jgi:hypothetical protein
MGHIAKFQDSLGYIARPCLNKTKPEKKKHLKLAD